MTSQASSTAERGSPLQVDATSEADTSTERGSLLQADPLSLNTVLSGLLKLIADAGEDPRIYEASCILYKRGLIDHRFVSAIAQSWESLPNAAARMKMHTTLMHTFADMTVLFSRKDYMAMRHRIDIVFNRESDELFAAMLEAQQKLTDLLLEARQDWEKFVSAL